MLGVCGLPSLDGIRPRRLRRWAWRPRSRRRAAVVVELALILPVLLILVLGAIDLGRVAYDQMILTNAARLGANFGSLTQPPPSSPEWVATVSERVVEEAQQLAGFNEADLEVLVEVLRDQDVDWVEVRVSYPFRAMVAWPGMAGEVRISRRVRMPVSP